MKLPESWPNFSAAIITTSGVCTRSTVANYHTHRTECMCESGQGQISYKHAGVAYCGACHTYFSYNASEYAK